MQPSNTFHNLPQDKQERIIEVAVREFADNGYRRASLNNMVRRLGIAKGSMYQYFPNKEGLFLHVFDRFTDQVKETLGRAVKLDSGEDFIAQLKQSLHAGLAFIDQNPAYYQLYLRVLFEAEVPEREKLLAKVRLFSMDYFGGLCLAAQKRGQIRADVSCDLVVFLVESVLDRFLQSYAVPENGNGLHLAKKSGAELEQTANTIIEVLRTGLCPM